MVVGDRRIRADAAQRLVDETLLRVVVGDQLALELVQCLSCADQSLVRHVIFYNIMNYYSIAWHRDDVSVLSHFFQRFGLET